MAYTTARREVGQIIPRNFPIDGGLKLAPALAAGNTAVLKPRRADTHASVLYRCR